MPYVLTTGALLLTWVIFRYERFSRRQSAIAEARAVVDAVLTGMVNADGEPQGWGDLYFLKVYTDKELAVRTKEAGRVVFEEKRFDQVFEVPIEPLVAVATAANGPDLVLKETRFAANTALWRIRVFNQLVRLETAFNAQHSVEVRSERTPRDRREDLAKASEMIVAMLHRDGIGYAGTTKGWYGVLRQALRENVQYLDDLQGWSIRRHFREFLFVLGDVVFTVVFVAILYHAV